jgi:flagellar motor switch protein FliM
LAGRVLLDLDAAWRPLGALESTLLGSETNPVLATVAAPDDLLVVIELRVALDDADGGGLAIAVPDAALDPIRGRLEAAVASEGAAVPAWGEQWHAALNDVELEVVAELGTHTMPLAEVLRLKVGDVIALQSGRGGAALVRVEGRPYFRAEPGLTGTSRAVRVTARF